MPPSLNFPQLDFVKPSSGFHPVTWERVKTLLCQICENLKKDLVTISIQGQLRNHHQVQKNSTEHAKFEFQNGLLYFDGLLYVPNGPTRLQVLQAMHDVLVVNHFGFNKTMELVFQNYWWP